MDKATIEVNEFVTVLHSGVSYSIVIHPEDQRACDAVLDNPGTTHTFVTETGATWTVSTSMADTCVLLHFNGGHLSTYVTAYKWIYRNCK